MLLAGGFTGAVACASAPPSSAFASRPAGALTGAIYGLFARDLAAGQEPATRSRVLFSGVPPFVDGEALLFDSAAGQDAGRLPDRGTIVRLEVRFPDGTPQPGSLDPGLCLLLFVDDLAVPRARVRLADLVRQRGERPLNLSRAPGQELRLVLADPSGAWRQGGQRLEVALTWQPQG